MTFLPVSCFFLWFENFNQLGLVSGSKKIVANSRVVLLSSSFFLDVVFVVAHHRKPINGENRQSQASVCVCVHLIVLMNKSAILSFRLTGPRLYHSLWQQCWSFSVRIFFLLPPTHTDLKVCNKLLSVYANGLLAILNVTFLPSISPNKFVSVLKKSPFFRQQAILSRSRWRRQRCPERHLLSVFPIKNEFPVRILYQVNRTSDRYSCFHLISRHLMKRRSYVPVDQFRLFCRNVRSKKTAALRSVAPLSNAARQLTNFD